MKKSLVALLLLGLFLLSISNVSAASIVDGAKKVGDGIVSLITPIAESLLGTVGDNQDRGKIQSQDLFAMVLFFLLILGLTWAVLDRISIFNEHTWVMVLFSVAIPTLSIRFLSMDYIHAILVPYSTFGIVVLTLIPLILLFIIIETSVDSSVFRKIGWMITAVVFIGLYFTRLDELGKAWWIYPAASVACLAFLFADGTIQRAFKQHKWEQNQQAANRRRMIKLANRKAEADKALESGNIDLKTYKEESDDIDNLLKQIAETK